MKKQFFTAQVLSFALVGMCASSVLSWAKPATAGVRCELNTLPIDLQRALATQYSSWKIQELSNLSPRAKERWESEKPLGCPGVAIGEFEVSGQSSYAVLVVPVNIPDSAYKLFVYTQNPTGPSGGLKKLDEWDKGGASNNFIHSIVIAKVFSRDWIKKLSVGTRDGILTVDSGENEYGVEVYFWSQDHYRHEWIDY